MPPEPPPVPTDVTTISNPFNIDWFSWRAVVDATNLRIEHSLAFTPNDFIIDLIQPLANFTLGGLRSMVQQLPDYSATPVPMPIRDEPATTLIVGVQTQATGMPITMQALL